jgi:hypothetical protein
VDSTWTTPIEPPIPLKDHSPKEVVILNAAKDPRISLARETTLFATMHHNTTGAKVLPPPKSRHPERSDSQPHRESRSRRTRRPLTSPILSTLFNQGDPPSAFNSR